MNNSIELTQSQVKRIEQAEKGETVLLMFPILLPFDDGVNNYEYNEEFGIWNAFKNNEHITSAIPPIRKGDKDIYVKEEFIYIENVTSGVIYKEEYMKNPDEKEIRWDSPEYMTKTQSRFTISECIDARVVRVQDININKRPTKEKKFYEQFTYHCTTEPINLKRGRAFKEFYNRLLKESNINRTYEDNDYIFLVEVKR